MLYENTNIYETIKNLSERIDDLNAIILILGIIIIAEIIAIVMIEKDTEKLAKEIKQFKNKNLDEQG